MQTEFKIEPNVLLLNSSSPPLFKYGVSVLLVAIAALAAKYIQVIGEEGRGFLFLLAVFHATLLFGRAPGYCAAILSLLVLNVPVLLPGGNYRLHDTFILSAVLALASGILICATASHRKLTLALWESRKDLNHAQAIGQIGSWVLNMQTNELHWSEQNHLIFGIPKGTPLNYAIYLSCVHPEDREYVDRKWRAGLRGEPYDIEHRLIVAEKIKWLRARAELQLDGKGRPLRWFGTAQDITERKQAETALAASEERLLLILRSAELGSWHWNVQTGSADFNDLWASMLGYRPDQIEPHISAWEKRIHPDDLPQATAALAKHLNGQTPLYRSEHRLQKKNGDWIWVLNCGQVYQRDTQGAPLMAAGVNIDISSCKKNEEERQKFVMLADNSKEFIGMCDMNLMPFYVNPAGMQMVGLDSLGQALQTPVQQFFFPEDQDYITESFLPRVIREGNGEMEIRFRHFKSGAALWVIYNVFYIKDLKGAPIGLATVSRDITARKLAEDAHRKISRHLKLAVEAAAAALWDRDLSTGSVYFSLEWKRQIGYRPDELPNHWEEWEKRLHPDDREHVLAMTRDCLEQRLPTYEFEYRLCHKNGSYRWIHTRGALLYDSKGQPCRLLGLNLDITGYKKAVELNERRNKMDEATRHQIAIQTAAAFVHEINQPLMAVASYTDIALHLVEEVGNPNPEQLALVLNKSSEQLERAGQIIRQLMNMLQKDEITSEPVVLDDVVHEACDIIRAESNLGDFNIELCLAPQLPPVQANPLQVEKVLVNLLRNGLDAMQEAGMDSGSLTITTGVADDDETMARVTVHDSGRGVDPEKLNAIFQPFFSTKSKGLGMGLAISRALIEAHGGKLWAEQSKGSGLFFHFNLPFKP
ncbi:PAS domain-containing protein [Methylomicrobium lacus]|uniref:PAS domain-containing protein n=1 Tax=Methylomicrobium lacus TaxID=136992 RepID=UPI0035A882AF